MSIADHTSFPFAGNKLQKQAGPAQRFFFLICVAWVAGCLTCLFLAMRAVLRLGGFVASGGPYVIAHPAPDWVWLVPVSIVTGIAAALVGFFTTRHTGRANLLWLAWPALFVSLGWNFLEFGFSPPTGQGMAWGWVICGFIFIPMGLLPLLAVVFPTRNYLRERLREQGRSAEWLEKKSAPFRFGPLVVQFLAAAAGIYGAMLLFGSLAG